MTLDLPAGWQEPSPQAGWDLVVVSDGPPGYAGSGWGVMFTTVGDVYRDPCDVSKGTIPAAQVNTPQKLAAAIAAWPGFTTTPARPITVDGHSALELKVAKKANSAGCGYGNAWLSSSGASVDAYPFASGSAYPTTIRIVDTGRGLLVIRATDFPNTSPFELGNGLANTPDRHAGDQAALHAILDSIRHHRLAGVELTPGDPRHGPDLRPVATRAARLPTPRTGRPSVVPSAGMWYGASSCPQTKQDGRG